MIMSQYNYITEAHRQLHDHTFYSPTPPLSIQLDLPLISSTLLEMKKLNLISDNIYNYLKPPNTARPRRFYILPKIHKPPDQWTIPNKMPKARPIVSDCNSHTYNLSRFIDIHLQPYANIHPSYIKDSADFLSKLKLLNIPTDCILVTIDVTSLYTNIPNDQALTAIETTFSTQPSPIHKYILKLIHYILTHNYFEFNQETYLQKSGVAMGQRPAPSIANIFMAQWEKKALSKSTHKPLCFYRFIDDIFMIWPHSLKLLTQFISHLNRQSPHIQLTHSHDNQTIDFLDITIYKGRKFDLMGLLDTTLFTKPTSSLELIHPRSYHPPAMFLGIIYSQMLRIKRICSSPAHTLNLLSKLTHTLHKQGYHHRKLTRIKHKTLHPPPQIPYATHNPPHYCQTCKLGVQLSHPDVILPPDRRFFCHTETCIYALLNTHSSLMYIGQTTNFKQRIIAHISDSKNNPNSPITRLLYPPSHFKITILEPTSNSTPLLPKESLWIHKLNIQYNLINPYLPPTTTILPCILPYSNQSEDIYKRIRHLIIPYLSKHYPLTQLVAAYTRQPNLNDLYTSSLL